MDNALCDDSEFQNQIKDSLPDVLYNLSVISSDQVKKHEPSSHYTLSHNKISGNSTNLAIVVDNLCKTYGKLGSTQILDNFSMKVPKGAIYSLLGSSGSGKSSLLNILVGLKKWDSGTISILGNDVSFASTEVARKIGYMPQELSLYEYLTVLEIIQYYAKLYNLTPEELEIKWRMLARLLDLSPKRFVQIKDLSGGQKRRVSLALALVHTPEILILDEPTVGLDPLLRKRIWDHLCELVYGSNTTVLITTHYVEETKSSDWIGIMRNGRMLVEDSPQSILSTYKSDLIQDSILQICRKDHEDQMANTSSSTESIPSSTHSTASTTLSNEVVFQYNGNIRSRSSIDLPDIKCINDKVKFCGFKEKNADEIICENWENSSQLYEDSSCQTFGTRCEKLKNCVQQSLKRTSSFSCIMWIYLIRQPIFLFILLFIPAVQLFMTFYVVGREPTNLSVGIINLEVLSATSLSGKNFCQNVSLVKGACDLKFLSCHIQNKLGQTDKLALVHLTSREDAEELIQNGDIFGYITFPRNYSENLVNRFMWGRFASENETFENSKVTITLDKSHYLAYHLILQEVMESMEYMSKSLEEVCGFDQHNHEIPLHYREPVYGKLKGTHQESIMPAIVAQILFEILYGIAPMILIKDLKQGTFARSYLAGLRFSEFMMGIFVTMGPILLLQSISCYLVLQYGFSFEVKGSFVLFICLCLVAGLCGQGFGIFVGILVRSEFAVIVSAIMVVPIIMTCSGTLWPLESHPGYLMVTYYVFPSALMVSSFRSVVNRGVGLTHALVWPGLVNSLSWSAVFWLLSIYGFRRMARM